MRHIFDGKSWLPTVMTVYLLWLKDHNVNVGPVQSHVDKRLDSDHPQCQLTYKGRLGDHLLKKADKSNATSSDDNTVTTIRTD